MTETVEPAVEMTAAQAMAALDEIQPAEGKEFQQYGRKSAAQKMELAMQVLSYTLQGWTLRQIGTQMGMSHVTASRYKSIAMATLTVPMAEEARKEDLELIRILIAGALPLASTGDKDAAATVLKAMDRRAKLLGLDQPTRIEAHVTETTQEDLALAEMIREARVAEMNREAQIVSQ